ncbi:MAG: lysophospholipase [Bacteroidales bacterium]|nr:lysophospholipase [Bacteroidales bacterium]
MKNQQQRFIPPQGGERYSHEWIPAESPEFCLLIIHGLADHIGRFDYLAEYLCRHRISVAGFDLEGNGQSPGRRGHFSSLEKVWEEMSAYIRSLRTRFPGLPVILYGQSMGGNLAMNFGIRYPGEADGIIASSPWIRLTRPPSKALLIPLRILHSLLPNMLLNNGVKGSDLSHDPKIATRYHSDPLVHGKISLRTFFLITHAGEYLLRHANKLNTPLLLMHGTADPVTSYEASKAFFCNLPPSRFHLPTHLLLSWPGLFHELHNEREKDKVIEAVIGWIKRET